jgi:hypothetical protein
MKIPLQIYRHMEATPAIEENIREKARESSIRSTTDWLPGGR